MLSKRIIPCLDVRDGKLTKGIKFKGNVDIGDPVEMAAFYYEEGADELVFYDITNGNSLEASGYTGKAPNTILKYWRMYGKDIHKRGRIKGSKIHSQSL